MYRIYTTNRGMALRLYRKLLLVMRLTTVILIASLMQVSAATFGQRITMDKKKASLEAVLKEIRKQSGYDFYYDGNVLSSAPSVNISLKNASLPDALRVALAGLDITYTIKGNIVSIKKKAPSFLDKVLGAFADIDVRGTVVDADGNALSGATVKVKGTNRVVVTDNNGEFNFRNVDENAVLEISYLGYRTREVKVAKNMPRISLELSSGELSEVFVISTGYQTLPKDRSTGSFAHVDAGKMAQKSTGMNVVDRLEGLVPGLAVNYGQGNDKLVLRGVSSVNLSRQPLIVLDGVPVAEYRNIESLVNPADVKDITVLKDATAASIWGAQAANGVIVITTKSGEYNSSKINIAYDGFVSFKGMPDYSSLNLMSGQEYIAAAKQLFQNSNYLTAFPFNTVNAFSNGNYPRIYPHEKIFYDLKANPGTEALANQRWDSLANLSNREQIDKNFYQQAMLSSHSVTLSGGGRFNKFFGSLAYSRYDNADKSTRDRYNFNLREEWKLAKWLTLDLTGNMSYEKNRVLNNISYPTPFVSGLDNYVPYALFADGNGKPLSHSYLYMTDAYRSTAEQRSKISLDNVPLNELNYNRNDNSVLAARVNAGLKVNLYKGLSFTTRGQYQKTIDDGYNFYDQNAYRVRLEVVQFTPIPAAGAEPVSLLPRTGGHYATNKLNVTARTIRNQLDYNLQTGDHQITALAGQEVKSTLFDATRTLTRGYDFQTQTYTAYNQKDLENPGIPATGATGAILPAGTSSRNTLRSVPITRAEDEFRFISFYGNLAYAYKNRYNFNGSLRYDQSNLFGKSKSSQNKPIWSVGLSWNMDREDFFKSELISKLMLRGTYGIAGNSPAVGKGGVADVLYASNSPTYAGLGTGYVIISPANNRLVWEETRSLNLGVDFELLDQRISGTVDYYSKKTPNLLGDRPLDPTTGWTSAYGNLGEMRNKGVEISINSRNISQNEFSWTTNFNISHNKNKVVSLKRPVALTVDSKTNGGFIEGYSAYSLFAYKYAGLNADGNPMVYKQDGSTGMFTNQLALADTYYQGSTQPLWYGGITNTFRYKDFTLSGLIVYNLGNVMRADANRFYSGRLLGNIQSNFNERWQNPGDEANTDVPKYIPSETTSLSQRTTSFYNRSDVNIISASYIRLRDLTLSYDLFKSGLSKLHLQKARVYAQVTNVLLWTKNDRGIDPEYYDLSQGTRLKVNPAFYTLGLNLSF
ncbi:TonB-linked SusC/RagA family outer membrane protein [Pedobacter africanus]|uniref:TonB-linked SusC/RagA family outer membrane protein n=1 Tax=Pedobacter africanus TaxID=151894 RepID=A0ACC6KU26_9SPHI|nr:SusC/RagA family TonB-linked outer membrane protein [Pedobacter africanus]MDR6782844.1 TonB-linked SusC/RagA family outer membrane protein [Pedobacter africanus]